MNKIFFNLIIFFLFLIATCISKAESGFILYDSLKAGDTVTVTGTALNAKLGAIVQTENSTYYVEGLDSWPDNYYKKDIEVKDILKIEIYKEEDLKDENGNWKSRMTGEKKTITQAVWKIIEK